MAGNYQRDAYSSKSNREVKTNNFKSIKTKSCAYNAAFGLGFGVSEVSDECMISTKKPKQKIGETNRTSK